MKVIQASATTISWKDKLMGNSINTTDSQKEEDFKLVVEDARKMIIDGILTITFSNRVHQIISRQMAWTVIVKLLEREISYLTMSNKLQEIWKIKQPLQIIDLENDYFSVKFQEDNVYLDALLRGPWTIFGHYLTIQSWTPAYSTDQVQPQNLMVWIRLLELPKGMYTKSLLRFIGSVVGSVAKIEQNIDNNVRGKFTWLAVYMDLEKPLVSKVKINEKI
ncbi:hypothetical protein PVK06_002634 [Gossypium arboreum]|uniref:DUF4283 domain-containing protein n=1 Tax=Gossypium arboreum TaxID=29729 RepID=A0ABR0R5A3_GOSAR|nr:hypothetical protein PVK06_002634 [Gossypium arboreum]